MKKSKIVIIGPTDFGISNHIVSSLKLSGHDILFIPEFFKTNIIFIDRFVARLPAKLISDCLAKYIVSKLHKKNFNDADTLLVIRGRWLNVNSLEHIDKNFNFRNKIMYQWDSSQSLPFFKNQINFFDSIASFDANDCHKFGLKHRHLFSYIKKPIYSTRQHLKYSICFIGTLHGDRGRVIKELLDRNSILRDRAFISLYIPFMTYLWHKLKRSPLVFGVRWKDLSFFRVSPENNLKIMSMSSMILDIAQPEQSGFTLRTFEALGLKKKLITTNQKIQMQDFYKAQNIYVISRDKLNILDSFIKISYINLNDRIYHKYSVEGWIEDVLGSHMKAG
jgi:hypothetical protein